MFTKMSNLINRDLVVTQDFIDYRNYHWNQGSYKSEKNCDYLFLEWWLIKNKLASPPSHRWRHDLRFNFNPPHLTDCKRIETDNFNITDPKSYYNLKQSIFEKNMLTHFLFYTTEDSGELFQVGDIVPHRFIKYEKAENVISRLIDSQFTGWYCKVA